MRVAVVLMNTFLMSQNKFEDARFIGVTNMDTLKEHRRKTLHSAYSPTKKVYLQNNNMHVFRSRGLPCPACQITKIPAARS